MAEVDLQTKLLFLMTANIDLPVQIIVKNGYNEYSDTAIGKITGVFIDEYLYCENTQQTWLKGQDHDIIGTLVSYYIKSDLNALPLTEDECRPYYDALPWRKAIIVTVDI